MVGTALSQPPIYKYLVPLPDPDGFEWPEGRLQSSLKAHDPQHNIKTSYVTGWNTPAMGASQGPLVEFGTTRDGFRWGRWNTIIGHYLTNPTSEWGVQAAREAHSGLWESRQALRTDRAPSFGEYILACPATVDRGTDLVVTTMNGERFVVEFKRQVSTEAREERSRRIAAMERLLRGYSELPENWNSYGAPAPAPKVIDEARKVLTAVIDLGLSEPWVAPGGDGSIGLQWETAQAFLYIDIVPGQETTYFHSPKTEGTDESEGTLTTDNLREVLRRFGESTIEPKP